MSNRKPLNSNTLAMSMALVLGGCSSSADPPLPSGELHQPVDGWNSQVWNSQVWNSQVWNSQVWNGMGWDGTGGTPGIDWYSIGWTGSGWTGNAWGGTGNAQDCTISTNNDSCTTLHDWVNHVDIDQNGTIDNTDKELRMGALGAWVTCACPPNVFIPFSDTHGYTSKTFQGGLGLAPTWCSSSGAAVPESEMQIVSACLMTKINMKGLHYPLSLRSTEAGTAVGINENMIMSRPLALYWGNLWKAAHADYDSTSLPPTSSTDLTGTGGPWWNLERFTVVSNDYRSGTGMAAPISDQYSLGRDCEVSTCGNHLEWFHAWIGHKQFGDGPYPWGAPSDNNSYYLVGGNYAGLSPDNSAPGDLQYLQDSYYGGGTYISGVSYRGHSWRAMQVYGPQNIPLEKPWLAGTNTSSPYNFAWAQVELGTIPSSQSGACTQGLVDCDGIIGQPPLKLLGLTSSQSISINLTGNRTYPGDPDHPVSLAIRYSRGPTQICTWNKFGEEVCHSSSTAGKLTVAVNNIQPRNVGWTALSQPTGHTLFPPTGSDDNYGTAYVYPIYPQDSITTIAGQYDYTTGVTYDTVRVKLTGQTASTTDAPQLDSAYYFDGPPPPGADCSQQGANTACFILAVPSSNITVPVGTWSSLYNSPILPAGSYSFTLANVSGSLGLSVQATGSGPFSWPSCYQTSGGATTVSCSVTLPAPGYINVSSFGAGTNSSGYQPTATFSGRN